MKESARRLLILTVLYTVIAIAAVYPASLHPNEYIIGGGELGGWLWRYWWMKLEIKALWVEMGDFPLQLFLHIISLGRFPETGNVTDLYAISYPLDMLFGYPTYYNFKCMLIVVTNGLAGYAMSRAFTKSPVLAFVGGAVLAMNSFVALEFFGSGLRQAILAPTALAVLSMERLFTRGSFKDGAATGFFFALTAIFYWFYGLFIFLFAVMRGLVALPALYRDKRKWTKLLLLLESAAIAIGLATIFAYPYIMFKLDHTGQLPEVQYLEDFPSFAILQAATEFPRNVDENLMASLKRVLHSSWSLDYLWNPLHPRNITFAAFGVSIVGSFLFFKRNWFWLLAFAFFFLHTGGPFLMTEYNPGAYDYIMDGDEPFRLLYAYTFKYVPLMSRLFAPYRAGGYVWVMLSVLTVLSLDELRWRFEGRGRDFALAGMGAAIDLEAIEHTEVTEIDTPETVETPALPTATVPETTALLPSEKKGRPWVAPVLASIFIGLFFGQQFGDEQVLDAIDSDMSGSLGRGLPVNTSRSKVHPFYHDLGKEKGFVGVIELPFYVQQDLITYYQVTHEKKVMEGWAMPGALPPYLRFVRKPRSETSKLLQFLTQPDTAGPNSFVDSMKSLSKPPYRLGEFGEQDLARLSKRGWRYVLLHERGCYMLWPEEGRALYEALRRRLSKELGAPAEVVEIVGDDDPEWEAISPHAGILGNWASSAIPIKTGARPTRYHMSVFLIPNAGWGEAWEGAVAWPSLVDGSAEIEVKEQEKAPVENEKPIEPAEVPVDAAQAIKEPIQAIEEPAKIIQAPIEAAKTIQAPVEKDKGPISTDFGDHVRIIRDD